MAGTFAAALLGSSPAQALVFDKFSATSGSEITGAVNNDVVRRQLNFRLTSKNIGALTRSHDLDILFVLKVLNPTAVPPSFVFGASDEEENLCTAVGTNGTCQTPLGIINCPPVGISHYFEGGADLTVKAENDPNGPILYTDGLDWRVDRGDLVTCPCI